MAKLWLDHRIWIRKDQQIIGFMLWHDIIIIKYSDISIFQLQLYPGGFFLQVKVRKVQIIFTKKITVEQKVPSGIQQ